MKKLIISIIAALTLIPAAAEVDYGVDVEIAYGLGHLPDLKKAIEQNTAKMLYAINEAADRNRGLNYSGVRINLDAKQVLNSLWASQHMRYMSFDEEFNTPISEKVAMNKYGEYELRNIPMVFINPENPSDSHYEEIGFTFSPKGEILDVFVTIERNQFQKMMNSMTEIKDESQRLTILYWMEAMGTAYHEKNIQWFEQFLSDDVLIVTGSRKYTPSGEKYTYTNLNKDDYISRLRANFKRNAVIEVKFSNMTVYGHPLDDQGRYYAVECEQSYFSSTYSDEGNLFVIWDFGIADHPQILFRGWTEKEDPTRFNIIDAVKINLDD